MSVHSEYKRVLAELVSFLDATGVAGCASAARELEACSAASAEEGLGDAATRTLELCATLDLAPLSTSQCDEFQERAEHLGEICRALLP